MKAFRRCQHTTALLCASWPLSYGNLLILCRRMDYSIRCAWAHGTSALRTHLINMTPLQTGLTWPSFKKLRAQWKGKVATLICCSLQATWSSSAGSWLACVQVSGSWYEQYAHAFKHQLFCFAHFRLPCLVLCAGIWNMAASACHSMHEKRHKVGASGGAAGSGIGGPQLLP